MIDQKSDEMTAMDCPKALETGLGVSSTIGLVVGTAIGSRVGNVAGAVGAGAGAAVDPVVEPAALRAVFKASSNQESTPALRSAKGNNSLVGAKIMGGMPDPS